MKKIFKYVPIILGLVMVMSSCGEDDGTEPTTTPAPSLNYSVNGDADMSSYTVTTGDAITIAITANKVGTSKDLDLISIAQNGANVSNGMMMNAGNNVYDFSTSAAQTIKNADDETFAASGTFTGITTQAGTTTYTITVTDKDGLSTSKSFDIVVENATTPFTFNKMGAAIFHIEGQARGSWSLETDTTVAKAMSATMADIRNTNAAGDAFTGAFRVGTSRTTTDFVVAASGFDYDNANVTNTTAAYNAGTAVTSATPTVGAVYIFSVNGTITLVKITAIDPNDTTGGTGNPGKMTFDYKR